MGNQLVAKEVREDKVQSRTGGSHDKTENRKNLLPEEYLSSGKRLKTVGRTIETTEEL